MPKPASDAKALAAVRKDNMGRFEKWVRSNGAEVRPRREIALFYAGEYLNPGKPALAKAVAADPEAGPHFAKIWAYIQQMTDNPISGKLRYSSIDTALQSCPAKPPGLLDPLTGKAVAGMRTMYHYAHGVTRLSPKGDGAYLEKTDQGRVWSALSKLYAKNTKGEVMIFAEFFQDFEKFRKTSDLLNVELKELARNPHLSDAAKRHVLHYIDKYVTPYRKKAPALAKAVAEAGRALKAKPGG